MALTLLFMEILLMVDLEEQSREMCWFLKMEKNGIALLDPFSMMRSLFGIIK